MKQQQQQQQRSGTRMKMYRLPPGHHRSKASRGRWKSTKNPAKRRKRPKKTEASSAISHHDNMDTEEVEIIKITAPPTTISLRFTTFLITKKKILVSCWKFSYSPSWSLWASPSLWLPLPPSPTRFPCTEDTCTRSSTAPTRLIISSTA